MADPAPSTVEEVLDDVLESAQRLAIDVIGYSPDKRDEVMWRMGILLAQVACEAGCMHEMVLSLVPQWSRSFAITLQRSRQAAVELSAQVRM